jgi:chaperonin GroES
MNQRITPLYDRMVVRVMEREEVTKSGIIIPVFDREDLDERKGESKAYVGEVMEIGKGRIENGVLVPMEVSKGDVIIFMRYHGNKVRVGKDEFWIVREGDILCRLDPGVSEVEVEFPAEESGVRNIDASKEERSKYIEGEPI